MPCGRNSIVFRTATAHDYPTPVSCHRIFPAAEYTRPLCRVNLLYQTTLPVGCTRLAVVRLIAKCADISLVSDDPHICFLLDLLQLLLLLPLLMLRSANGHAVRLKISRPPPTARRAHYTPIAGLQLLLYFPPSAGIPPSLRPATPSPSESSDDGGTAALLATPSVGGD